MNVGETLQVKLPQAGKGPTHLCAAQCISCKRLIVDLVWTSEIGREGVRRVDQVERIYPLRQPRPNPPDEVPDDIRRDYIEASAVEHASPRASAVLLRRALQASIRALGHEARTLYQEIEQAIKDTRTPPDLGDLLHTVREVGNYAAHPSLDPSTGDVLQVEEHELEVLFEVLMSAFDVYFVRPERLKEKKRRIDEKLGKEPVSDA